jgi:phosphoenolpyruvate carboxykinase (GTP)
MLVPPERYKQKGYEIFCLGDDIAWMHIGEDGRLWAINPENGFFGVVPGTNNYTNPNAMACMKKNTIFTNVVQNLDDNTVWWEGLNNELPQNALNWKGELWNAGTSDTVGAHPNSRFTSYAKNCPCLSNEFDNPNGVPISAIIFGGRRAKVTPLVYQTKSWSDGVFSGSMMASETTSAALGKTGVTRQDPMAMLPFCGYNIGAYFEHWLEMGKKLGEKAPKIFNVNWFRQDSNGRLIWPGFKENIRVLEWILKRCNDEISAKETAIGFIPFTKDINIKNLDLSSEDLDEISKVDKNLWLEEVEKTEEFYDKLGTYLPIILKNKLNNLKEKLKICE